MTKQLSAKQKALLRDAIQIAKEGLQHVENMHRVLDEMEKTSR